MLLIFIMVNCLIVNPRTMLGRTSSKVVTGNGVGSVLLGSSGVGSTYTADAPSPGGFPQMEGQGLGKSIASKLEKLRVVTKKKPANIKFSL